MVRVCLALFSCLLYNFCTWYIYLHLLFPPILLVPLLLLPQWLSVLLFHLCILDCFFIYMLLLSLPMWDCLFCISLLYWDCLDWVCFIWAAYICLIQNFSSEAVEYIMLQSAFVKLFTPDTMSCLASNIKLYILPYMKVSLLCVWLCIYLYVLIVCKSAWFYASLWTLSVPAITICAHVYVCRGDEF